MEKEKNKLRNGKECTDEVKIINCQMGLSFVLWPSSFEQLSS